MKTRHAGERMSLMALAAVIACAVQAAPGHGKGPQPVHKAPPAHKAPPPHVQVQHHPSKAVHHAGPSMRAQAKVGRPMAGGHGLHVPPPHHHGFHAGRPHGARFWARPGLPPVLFGARRAWAWVATPWYYTVDGVYYYGEGYYFDGYNYCYNGGYYLTPPPVQQVIVTTQPVVVSPQPVVVQPAPVVVQPQPVIVQPRRRSLSERVVDAIFGY